MACNLTSHIMTFVQHKEWTRVKGRKKKILNILRAFEPKSNK